MKSRPVILTLLVAAVGIVGVLAREREQLRKHFVGQAPPELVCTKGDWLGKSPPVTLSELKDRVIWLQFNF